MIKCTLCYVQINGSRFSFQFELTLIVIYYWIHYDSLVSLFEGPFRMKFDENELEETYILKKMSLRLKCSTFKMQTNCLAGLTHTFISYSIMYNSEQQIHSNQIKARRKPWPIAQTLSHTEIYLHFHEFAMFRVLKHFPFGFYCFLLSAFLST